MDRVADILGNLGLARNEVKVYLALLDLGSSKAGAIAKRALLDRTSTYGALQILLRKGIISYVIVGKVNWFQAADPVNLQRYLQNKVEDLDSVIPWLKQRYVEKPLRSNVRLFKGKKGVKAVLNDIVIEEKSNFLFGSEGQLEQMMPDFAHRLRRDLARKRIVVRSLVRDGRSDSHATNVRFVPRTVKSPVVTNIYGDKISLVYLE